MTRLAATQRCVSFEVKRFEEGQRWDGNPKYSTLSWKGIAALIDLLLLKKRLLYRTLYRGFFGGRTLACRQVSPLRNVKWGHFLVLVLPPKAS